MRKTMNIRFDSYDMIERFSRDIANVKGEFDLVSGRKVIDAKSFLGIFSLDLSKPVTIQVESDDPQDFLEKVKSFSAEN